MCFSGVDGMGLFWSVAPLSHHAQDVRLVIRDVTTPLTFTFALFQGHISPSDLTIAMGSDLNFSQTMKKLFLAADTKGPSEKMETSNSQEQQLPKPVSSESQQFMNVTVATKDPRIDKPIAVSRIQRSILAAGVRRIEIKEGRIRGTLFLPPGELILT